MNKFTLKNYPPQILIIIVCLIAALDFGIQVFWKNTIEHENLDLVGQMVVVFTSYSLVVLLIGSINKYVMWNWLLGLLKIHDIRGEYTGQIISSYYEDDNPSNNHRTLFCKVHIIQNINGFSVSGEFYSDPVCNEKSSTFSSSCEEIDKLDNGNFQLRYLYSNKGHQLNATHTKYFLNNHEGFCLLEFKPKDRTMEGYYFNHERSSYGTMSLSPQV